ncbi:MAG: DUF4185 domain-containing protein [Bacteroidales bacterium]|nr:DUF4185 domain-containing protein [Bacteroidales bacterium]
MKQLIAVTSLLILFFTIACNSKRELTFSKATYVARVTGDVLAGEMEEFPNSNRTGEDFNIGATDLGIIWEMKNGEYGIFFGDTYGRDHFKDMGDGKVPNYSDWRCNVLVFSNDRNLEDGLTFDGAAMDPTGSAREIIYGAKDQSGTGDWTSIPTGAICANGIDYVHYMNVKNWLKDNDWISNYSGLYRSRDSGRNWEKCENMYWDSGSNFGQVGYWKKDGYVYMMGTETGRKSTARVARFREGDIEEQDQYEYWNEIEKKWIKGDELRATDLFEDTVGELSVIYHKKSRKWIVTYFCGQRYNITVRYADNITGPWSEPQELAHGSEFPQLYGSFIHPLSADGDHLYFLMSRWAPYNVFLMKSEVK